MIPEFQTFWRVEVLLYLWIPESHGDYTCICTVFMFINLEKIKGITIPEMYIYIYTHIRLCVSEKTTYACTQKTTDVSRMCFTELQGGWLGSSVQRLMERCVFWGDIWDQGFTKKTTSKILTFIQFNHLCSDVVFSESSAVWPPVLHVFSFLLSSFFRDIKPKRPFFGDLKTKPQHTAKQRNKKNKGSSGMSGPRLSSEAFFFWSSSSFLILGFG